MKFTAQSYIFDNNGDFSLFTAQRRHACLNEIQRLKNPSPKRGILRTSEGDEIMPCSGSVTIQDIRLPLKTEYVLNQGTKGREMNAAIFIPRCYKLEVNHL